MIHHIMDSVVTPGHLYINLRTLTPLYILSPT